MSCSGILQVTFVAVLFGLSAAQFSKKTGDSCRLNSGGAGICKSFDNCDLNLLARETSEPAICAWEGDDAIICCPSNGPSALASSKAEQKCTEYTKKRQEVTQTIRGGAPVNSAEEFPHSVLIGYSNPPQWYCGGTLISDRFVLTAAHCLTGKQRTKITVVHMGFVNKNSRNESGTLQEMKIINTYKPPERTVLTNYVDIALLEMERPVVYTKSVLPACLHNEFEFNVLSKSAIAFGWGDELAGSNKGSDVLQKVKLSLVDFQRCSTLYPSTKKIPQGIIDATQFCAGDKDKDTCQGDSGGPLQIHDTAGRTRIIGVTSFGSGCGDQPGVYTRVSAFIPWIESIVWP